MPDIHRRPGGPTTSDIVRADVAEEIREIVQGLQILDGSDPEQLAKTHKGLQHRLRLVADKLDGTRVL